MSVLFSISAEKSDSIRGIRLGRRTVIVPATVFSLILPLPIVTTMPSMPPPPPVRIPPVLTPVLIFLCERGSRSNCTSVVIRRKSELDQAEHENES